MKLRARFLQLPIVFDAGRLAEEVAAMPASALEAPPAGLSGQRRPAPDHHQRRSGARLPGRRHGAHAFSASPRPICCRSWTPWRDLGRSRLMRLSWRRRSQAARRYGLLLARAYRVHVPIVTQPTVRFRCGGEEVNMAPGECWIFDTWSVHSVHNDATRARIHLVADTVGGRRPASR